MTSETVSFEALNLTGKISAQWKSGRYPKKRTCCKNYFPSCRLFEISRKQFWCTFNAMNFRSNKHCREASIRCFSWVQRLTLPPLEKNGGAIDACYRWRQQPIDARNMANWRPTWTPSVGSDKVPRASGLAISHPRPSFAPSLRKNHTALRKRSKKAFPSFTSCLFMDSLLIYENNSFSNLFILIKAHKPERSPAYYTLL